jgi:synaptonemal complex protein 1
MFLRFCILWQNQASLTAAESQLTKAKKQHDMLLESKQLELSRHLKEISQRNDEVLSFIITFYESSMSCAVLSH